MEGLALRPSKQGREVVIGGRELIVAAMFTKQGRIWGGGIKDEDNRKEGLHGPCHPPTVAICGLRWRSGILVGCSTTSLISQIRFSPRRISFFSGDFYFFLIAKNFKAN